YYKLSSECLYRHSFPTRRSSDLDKLRWQALTVVDIRSLAPRSTFIKPLSWFVRGGLERTAVAGAYRLASYVEGGPGAAWRWRSLDRKSTRLNSSHVSISYAVFCL